MANSYTPSPMSNWNAGDGYAVDNNFLNMPDYSANNAGLGTDYYGGTDSVNQAYKSILDTGTPSITPNLGSGQNASSLGQGVSSLGGLASLAGGGSTIGAVGAGVGTIIGDYNNATTDTGSSVLSGVASGAATGATIGSVVPVVGTVFGAVVGGIIGGLAGFFGSKSKKKQANQQFQQNLAIATAPAQQAQANYLQTQKLTQAAISPYAAGYTPGGYQYKNKLFGGGSSNIPQPQSGTLNIPNAPPSITSTGLGKPTSANIPGASFTPNNAAGLGVGNMPVPQSTVQQQQIATPVAPKYSSNSATNQMNTNAYAQAVAKNYYLQDQQSAAAALNPYSEYFNQGY